MQKDRHMHINAHTYTEDLWLSDVAYFQCLVMVVKEHYMTLYMEQI